MLRDFQKLRRFAAQKFLELFGQLARQHHFALRENGVEFAQQFFDAIRRFIEHQRADDSLERFQFVPPLAGFVRQKTDEVEFVRRQATGGERRDQCARPRHRFDAEARRNRRLDYTFAGIADAGTAGIRDQRDFFAAPETFDDFLAASGFVELKIAEQRFGDAEMLQQSPGVARVLGGGDVALAQHAQRAQRDVLEVANGRGDEVKRPGYERRQCSVHALT